MDPGYLYCGYSYNIGINAVVYFIISMMGNGLADYTSVPVTQILEAMLGSKRFGYACAQGVSFGVILIMVSSSFKIIMDKLKKT